MIRLLVLTMVSILFINPVLAQSQTQLTRAQLLSVVPDTKSNDRLEQHHLEIARTLVKSGAFNLAYDYLHNHPPKVALVSVWEAWAEQKWSILILLNDWQALKQDAKGLVASFGGARNFSISYQARAMIALGEYDQARHLLQPALLAKDVPLRLQKDIRAQLIALYQAQGDYANARIEAIRFHDQFKPQSTSWFIRRAVIEYLAGDPASASQLLAAIASIEAKLLQIWFRYETHEIEATQALGQINKQLQRKRISRAERKFAFGIVAKINQLGDMAAQVARLQALEQSILIDAKDLHPKVLSFDAQHLKMIYLAVSESLVNQALLDSTQSSIKFRLAQQSQKIAATSKARALYVDVMLDGNDVRLSIAAKNEFVNSLLATDQYGLLTQLFGKSRPLGDFDQLSSTITAKILNLALTNANADLVSAIAPFLGPAPDKIKPLDWILQKARIDIFSGRFELGQSKINQWLSSFTVLLGEQVDRVLQPVFDLQAVGQDDISLEILDLITSKTNSKRHQREILFWKAQSYQSLEKREIAAQHFLRSAMFEANGYDQWGRSSRYHAASTLMEAGNHDDARKLLEGLLGVTTEVATRGTIKQALQRLWLLEMESGSGQ